MSTRYSTALSHVVLAGTTIYCLTSYGTQKLCFPMGCFGFIFTNSVIGIWRYGNPSYGDNIEKVYNFTSVLQELFALPCLVTSIWLNYGYVWELAYLHTLVLLIPFAAYISNKENSKLTDTLIGANCISLGVVSFLHQNYFGAAAAVSYIFDHFVVKADNETFFDIPPQDLYNYALCFFAFFALKALWD